MTMSDPPDYASSQQPSDSYDDSVADLNGYGPSQNAPATYGQAPVRIAERDVPTPKPKKAKETRTIKPDWKPVADGPQKATLNIYFLFYFPYISRSFSFDDYLARLHGSSDPSKWPETSQFLMNSIDILKKSDSDTVWTDLGSALHESGSVVIYMGHSERAAGAKKARKLRPRPDPDDGSSDITMSQLNKLLATVNAKCFIIAACATDGCIGKIKRDTAVIVTNSGKDLVTNSINWANALEKFLMEFVAGRKIADCLAEANKIFPASNDSDDSLKLASGLASLTLTT